MTRWWVGLAGCLLAVLMVWETGSVLEHFVRTPKRARIGAMTPAAPKIGDADPVALQNQIVHDDQVDEHALGEIESKNDAILSADAYFLAARYESDHKRDDAAVKYIRRALDFAPGHGGLRQWYAMLLLNSGAYGEAVTQGEMAAQLEPASADTQRVLGMAYYDAGRLPEAVAAWERAQQLSPTDSVAQYLEKAKREAAVEGNFSETTSTHFVLRYEGGKPSGALTDELLRTLERQFDEVATDLGFAPNGQVTVVLYSTQQFFDVTQAPAWAGALNDGKLRIPISDVSSITPAMEAVLAHELTHSFVHAAVRNCPAWLNEGLAQMEEPKSTDGFAPQLREGFRNGEAVRLRDLDGPFTRLTPEQAHLAYAKSLTATEYLRSTYGMDGVRRLLKLLAEGKDADAALTEVSGGGYAELEQATAAYLAKRSL